jgi:hypothetical protein
MAHMQGMPMGMPHSMALQSMPDQAAHMAGVGALVALQPVGDQQHMMHPHQSHHGHPGYVIGHDGHAMPVMQNPGMPPQ